MQVVLCSAYFAVLLLLAMYGLHRSHLVLTCLRYGKKLRALREGAPRLPLETDPAALPHVTIQLPLYNEATVVARLLEQTAKMAYPREKLEIQVLDDSTDESRQMARAKVMELRDAPPAIGESDGAPAASWKGELDMVYIHRVDRTGYKAGALDEGLKVAKGELIAIFDADFVPGDTFLRDLVPHFVRRAEREGRHGPGSLGTHEPRRLVAHARPGAHARRSPPRREPRALGRRLALQLLWHGRHVAREGHRRERRLAARHAHRGSRSLVPARRWQAGASSTARTSSRPRSSPRTSARSAPSRFRWAKGTVQTARKLMKRVMTSKLTLSQRVEAFFHMTPHFAYPLMVLLSVLLLPALILMPATNTGTMLLVDLPLCIGTTGSLLAFYAMAEAAQGRGRWQAVRTLPALLALGAGLAPHLSKAVFEGLRSMSGEFVRTPKHGEMHSNRYRARADIPTVEVILCLLSLGSVVASLETGHWFATPFAMLFTIGYGYVATLVGTEQLARRKASRMLPAGAQLDSIPPSAIPVPADSQQELAA